MPYDVIFKGTLLNGVEVERRGYRCKRRKDAEEFCDGATNELARDEPAWINRAAFAFWSFDVVKAPPLLRGKVKGGAK